MIISIDPGLFGAAVAITDYPRWRVLEVSMWDFRKASGTRRRDISPRIHGALSNLFKYVSPQTPIVIEDTGSMPEQGISSTHNFGMSRASAETSFLGTGARLYPVAPNLWKRQMGLSHDKKQSLRLAEIWLGRKLRMKDVNLAEAVLIGVWYAFRLAHLRIAPSEKAKFGLLS